MAKKSLMALSIVAIVASSTVSASCIVVDANGVRNPSSPGIQFVEDSYIVIFKAPKAGEEPLIWPPNRAGNVNTAPVPFGEHSTGQSKTELAITLGIKGEVVRILETINAAHLHVDAQEANRLTIDDRVSCVEQDTIISIASIETPPSTRSVAQARASGSLTRRTLVADLAPSGVDAGQTGHAFVAALLPDNSIYTLGSAGWTAYDPNNPVSFSNGALQALTATLATNADLSSLMGTAIYLGYGLGGTPQAAVKDMLQRSLLIKAYTVQ